MLRWFRKRRKSPSPPPDEARDEEAHEPFEPPPVVVTDVLDLHGFFPEQVPDVVGEFLSNALRLRLRRVRIIHGKGRSRLKHAVLQVLKERPEVESFGDAPPEFGGWGATVVYLKPGVSKDD